MKRKDLITDSYYEVLFTPNAYHEYLHGRFSDTLIRIKRKYRSISDSEYSTVYLVRCADERGSDRLEYHSQAWYTVTKHL